ncbi:hypothetical protein ACX9NE_28440 [Mycobacterium sp. ML4]
MSNVFEAIPTESRAVIEEELGQQNPELPAELRSAGQPTKDQTNATIKLLIRAMTKNFADDVPNERGKTIILRLVNIS